MEEKARLVRPANKEVQTEEVSIVKEYFAKLDPAKVKCLAVCVVSEVPDETNPDRHEAAHFVIGSKAQMGALIASQYSAIGRTFDAEKEAEEIPPEKKQ